MGGERAKGEHTFIFYLDLRKEGTLYSIHVPLENVRWPSLDYLGLKIVRNIQYTLWVKWSLWCQIWISPPSSSVPRDSNLSFASEQLTESIELARIGTALWLTLASGHCLDYELCSVGILLFSSPTCCPHTQGVSVSVHSAESLVPLQCECGIDS